MRVAITSTYQIPQPRTPKKKVRSLYRINGDGSRPQYLVRFSDYSSEVMTWAELSAYITTKADEMAAQR